MADGGPVAAWTFASLKLLIGAVSGEDLVLEILQRKPIRTRLLQLGCVVVVFAGLHFFAGFPGSREPFAANTSVFTLILMFICVVLGMLAEYVFNQKGEFSLAVMLKPLVVSPIVLLPLVGTVEIGAALEPIQLFCVALLAFQNGFFWRTVFKHEKNKAR